MTKQRDYEARLKASGHRLIKIWLSEADTKSLRAFVDKSGISGQETIRRALAAFLAQHSVGWTAIVRQSEPSSPTFAGMPVAAVDGADATQVVFVSNGKEIGRIVNIGEPNPSSLGEME